MITFLRRYGSDGMIRSDDDDNGSLHQLEDEATKLNKICPLCTTTQNYSLVSVHVCNNILVVLF